MQKEEQNAMYGIDETVDAFESILRSLEAGRPAAAAEQARLALAAAAEQQARQWQHAYVRAVRDQEDAQLQADLKAMAEDRAVAELTWAKYGAELEAEQVPF